MVLSIELRVAWFAKAFCASGFMLHAFQSCHPYVILFVFLGHSDALKRSFIPLRLLPGRYLLIYRPFRCILFRPFFSLTRENWNWRVVVHISLWKCLKQHVGRCQHFWRGDFAGDVCLVVCILSSLFDLLLVVSRANVCEVDCAVRTGRFTRCTVLVKQEVTQFWETLRNHSSMCGFSFSVYLFFFYSHESVCMLCASILSPELVTALRWLFRVVPFLVRSIFRDHAVVNIPVIVSLLTRPFWC